jgi:hypothetical protein
MTNKHHPSCTEHDKDLVWHCSQCGLNELADEQEIINRAQSEDKARLDWLDEQREPISYDGGATLHSYAWAIEAMHMGIREAIDAARKK